MDIDGNPTKIALLPSLYLLGYLAVQKDIFIENPNYAFSKVNKNMTISTLKSIFDCRYQKVIK